jgi:hypothetical protein
MLLRFDVSTGICCFRSLLFDVSTGMRCTGIRDKKVKIFCSELYYTF